MREILCTVILYAHWTQGVLRPCTGDKREDESIRVHRQLPVCRNDPFFSFGLHRGRAGNCHCDLNVIAPYYITDVLWDKTRYACCIAYLLIDRRE